MHLLWNCPNMNVTGLIWWSTLVQVMAWCRQATSHYLSQCWPRYVSPYGVTRPQWVKFHPARIVIKPVVIIINNLHVVEYFIWNYHFIRLEESSTYRGWFLLSVLSVKLALYIWIYFINANHLLHGGINIYIYEFTFKPNIYDTYR